MKKRQTQDVFSPRSGNGKLTRYKILDWITTTVIGFGVAAALLFGVFVPRIVEKNEVKGLKEGDLVFADRFSKYIVGIDRGDAVLLRNRDFLKSNKTDKPAEAMPQFVRVIAFAGEKVTVADGNVYIDDALLDESDYARDLYKGIHSEFTVPKGSVFVLPDDRFSVTEERLEELVISFGRIKGEVRFNAYPFSRLRLFK